MLLFFKWDRFYAERLQIQKCILPQGLMMKSRLPFPLAGVREVARELYQWAASQYLDHTDHYGVSSVGSYLKEMGSRMEDQIALELFLLGENPAEKKILTVGGWPGLTSIALKRTGATVYALDHPSLMTDSMAVFLKNMGVHPMAIDMKDVTINPGLPCAFDLVESCECIEHWNFNPIPAIQVLLDSLSSDGRLFITVPNVLALYQRVTFLFGRSLFPRISDFIKQMDPETRSDVAPHWREYTRNDLVDLIKYCGGDVVKTWYEFHPRTGKRLLRPFYETLMLIFPFLREHIGIIAGRAGQDMRSV